MKSSARFDVQARNTALPGVADPAWLVVCRRCGWHTETVEGYGWKGCPGCGEELTIVWPEATGIAPAPAAVLGFPARRKRNAWRSPPLIRVAPQ